MCARTVRRLVITPCPPALLPGATGEGSVPEVEQLRTVTRRAVQWLCEPGKPVLVLAAGSLGPVLPGTPLSAAAYGLNYRTRLGGSSAQTPPVTPVTPVNPGLLVAAYLLGEHPAQAIEVADLDAAHQHAIALDAAAVLVCGGGSARRRDGAPGYIDRRAVPFDDALVERIGSADLDALAATDLRLADELLSDLARPLAVAAQVAGRWAQPLSARIDSYCAPYGVANIVARWWTDA